MLAIFDIDGTICDSQQVEGNCFQQAIRDVTGIDLSTDDWNSFPEPTSSGIIRSLLAEHSDYATLEGLIEKRFLKLLKDASHTFPLDFSPIEGAVQFIEELAHSSDYRVAIATGGFYSEAKFKLECCGLDLDEFPHATSSDSPKRIDIIPLAAKRAKVPMQNCIYFGDAPWDLKATANLGIPIIGIGRKANYFQNSRALGHFRDYLDPNAIRRCMAFTKPAPSKS